MIDNNQFDNYGWDLSALSGETSGTDVTSETTASGSSDGPEAVASARSTGRRQSARLSLGQTLLMVSGLGAALTPSLVFAGNGTPEPSRHSNQYGSPVPTHEATYAPTVVTKPTYAPTATKTPHPTYTATAIPSMTPTLKPTMETLTPTLTPTATKTPEAATATPTATASPTEIATATRTATATPKPEVCLNPTDVKGRILSFINGHFSSNPVVADIEDNNLACPPAVFEVFGSNNKLPEVASPGDAKPWLQSQEGHLIDKGEIPIQAGHQTFSVNVKDKNFCWYQVDFLRRFDDNPTQLNDSNGKIMIDSAFVKGKDCADTPTPTATSTSTSTPPPASTNTPTPAPSPTGTPNPTETPQPSVPSSSSSGGGESPRNPTATPTPENSTKLCDITVGSDAEFVQLFPASRFGFSEWTKENIQEATTRLTEGPNGTRQKLINEHNAKCELTPTPSTPTATPQAPIPVPPAPATPDVPQPTPPAPETPKAWVCQPDGTYKPFEYKDLADELAEYQIPIERFNGDYDAAAEALSEIYCPAPISPPVQIPSVPVQIPLKSSDERVSVRAPRAEDGGANLTSAENQAIRETTVPYTLYTIEDGDTLWGISGELLGNGGRFMQIYNLNPELSNPDQITAGRTLRIPVLTQN